MTQLVPQGLVGRDIDGCETAKPFVRLVSERRLRTLLFCTFKLRNLETCHRGNATKRLRGWIISQWVLYI